MEEKENKQVRKSYKKHDVTEASQKPMTIRIDKRIIAWLQSKPNKGRYINNLIFEDMKKAWGLDDEHTHELDDLDNWEQ